MKKLAAGAVMALLLSGAGAAMAAPPSNPGNAGPNDHNLFGLCTAYAHNQNGQDHGNAENAPPFAALAQEAADNGASSVGQYCTDTAPVPGNSYPNG